MSEPSGFVNVAGLYERQTNSGKRLWFGKWGSKLRVYLFANERGGEPAFWLAIRVEDYDVKRDGPGQPESSQNSQRQD